MIEKPNPISFSPSLINVLQKHPVDKILCLGWECFFDVGTFLFLLFIIKYKYFTVFNKPTMKNRPKQTTCRSHGLHDQYSSQYVSEGPGRAHSGYFHRLLHAAVFDATQMRSNILSSPSPDSLIRRATIFPPENVSFLRSQRGTLFYAGWTTSLPSPFHHLVLYVQGFSGYLAGKPYVSKGRELIIRLLR